jgi:hypothetical protein
MKKTSTMLIVALAAAVSGKVNGMNGRAGKLRTGPPDNHGNPLPDLALEP